MAKIELPERFRKEYQSSSADDINDLASATAALKAKGKSMAEIAAKIAQAGWSPEFANWYADVLLKNDEEFELILPAPQFFPLTPPDPAQQKEDAARSIGTILGAVATIWLMGWAFSGIEELGIRLGILIVGIGLLWEGFARLAVSRSLSRLYGVVSMVVIAALLGLGIFWASLTEGLPREEIEGYAIGFKFMQAMVPTGISWLVFWLATNSAMRRKAVKAGGSSTEA
ncbi:MAG: hypothetical protein KF784_05385 [Fimbriimonadaceae bacterium]|nr:hypothetical protein [Fimbriimonadaceae bacterium]